MLVGVEAQAEVIPYTFEGAFQESNVPGISVWETFSCTLLYDNAATKTGPAFPSNYSDFDITSASITVTASGYTYEPALGSSVTYDTTDNVGMGGLWQFPSGSYDNLKIKQSLLTPNGDFPNSPRAILWFADADQDVFTGDASVLPSSLPSGFDYIELWLGTQIGDDEYLWAKGLVGASQPVPEPATVLLLGSGLVGLVGFRKKFKK
jgi:hypothetical protein